MTRRIIGSMIGVVFVTLLLTGVGTFVMARLVNTSEEVNRLEEKAAETNAVFVALDESLGGKDGATDRPSAAAALGRLRRQLVGALSVGGIGAGYLAESGDFVGDLPTGVRIDDLDATVLGAGGTVGGRRGDTLWAAAGQPETLRGGREVTVVTVLTQPQERFFGPTFRWYALSAAAAMLVAALGSFALGRRLGRPLHAAVDATQRIADGDLTARLPAPPPGDHDDIDELARSVNLMAATLERARDQERQFLMSVSHDLRTPLTSIRGYAEAIADGTLESPRRGAEVILAESRRLERMVGDLLDLARLDADRFDLTLQAADVVEIVASTLEGFAPELREAGLELRSSLDAVGPIVAQVDVDRLAQVVANLTANAIAFAHTTVWVTTTSTAEEVSIEVRDDGDGIPADAIGDVFDRLYQADNQPRRRGRGSGLGLAIVAELTARMGGRCDVATREGHGTAFTVRLPLRRS